MFDDLDARPSYLEDMNNPRSLPTSQQQKQADQLPQ